MSLPRIAHAAIMSIPDAQEEKEMSAGHCPNNKCDGPIHFNLIKSWPAKCAECGTQVRRHHMETYMEQTEANRMQLSKMMTDMKTCEYERLRVQ